MPFHRSPQLSVPPLPTRVGPTHRATRRARDAPHCIPCAAPPRAAPCAAHHVLTPSLCSARTQEAAPEDFFTPYIWTLVYELSGFKWQAARVVLFPIDAAEGGEPDDGLPMLSSIEVDESATVEADDAEAAERQSGF